MNLFLKGVFRQALKRVLILGIYYFGIVNLFIILQKRLKKRHYAAILFYHRFYSGQFENCQLPHLNIQEFKKQMRHIKKWYSIITMDDLIDRLAIGKEFSTPSIVLTIDDGYLNNYREAYPILKEFNLPAMIYLSTGFIGTENSTWVDDLMDVIKISKKKTISVLELFNGDVLDISTNERKMEVFEKIFNNMLNLKHEKKLALMEKLTKLLCVEEGLRDVAERRMLNWNEVIEMNQNNIYFGAHTISHPTLSKMELQEAKREIYESKDEIENKLGCKVNHFAIPNGKKEDFNEELKRYCKEIGFKTVVSTEPGVVSVQSDPYFLKRINPPPPIHVFAFKLARNMFFHRTK
jgi:peptidoglycan/xylan/chitin deacetylase (PgdA/CDA1 family)